MQKSTEKSSIILFNICIRFLFLRSSLEEGATIEEFFPAIQDWKFRYTKETGLDFAEETKKVMDALCLDDLYNPSFTKKKSSGVTYYYPTNLKKLDRLYESLYKEIDIDETDGVVHFRGYGIIADILASIDLDDTFSALYELSF